jgi:hypothetical protein
MSEKYDTPTKIFRTRQEKSRDWSIDAWLQGMGTCMEPASTVRVHDSDMGDLLGSIVVGAYHLNLIFKRPRTVLVFGPLRADVRPHGSTSGPRSPSANPDILNGS